MDITLEKKHENKLTFLAEGISPAFANVVRRYAMVHTPILAIDHVTFYENNSAVFDEYLAHRMGLLPLTTPNKTPASAEISFRLDETGPAMVYSESLKSSDKDITVGREKVPIITLAEDQHLRLEATARIGTGTEHAKFQAGLVSYSIDEKGIHFLVESFYQMTPQEVIVRGCDTLEKDLDELANAVKKAAGKKK